MKVAIIGGGVGGAAAALRLRQAGQEVSLYEASPQLGGLLASLQVGGEYLERYYHHVFPHEDRIQSLVGELGLELEWLPAAMGVYRGGRVWPFDGPRDLLEFKPISLPSRVRLGVASQLLLRQRHVARHDDMPAFEWLEKASGRQATETIWKPLLRGKFGPAAPDVPAGWMLGRLKQRDGARKAGKGELLGYMPGGFHRLFGALEERLDREGADVRVDTRVESIDVEDGRVTGVTVAGTHEPADSVLFAGTLPVLRRLMETDIGSDHEGLGVVCMVLELERQASPVYWLNVCDDDVPFGGVIEQTNFVPPERYGGRHVVYLSRYYTQEEEVAQGAADDLIPEWLEALGRVAPGFAGQAPLAVHVFRAPYAAPLVGLGYAQGIPPVIPGDPEGLALATTAQIYPEDRGMDNGVKLAERSVRELLRRG
ncbi:MAG: FAD-dependent oxidoreductase [Thermoleophilaceae bacterium]|nr:FAD-dependent oxidoreductase [Thermoleophilaceae bacterium]